MVLCQVCVRKVLTFSSVYKESVNFTTFFYFLKKSNIYIDIVVYSSSKKISTTRD